MDKKIIFLGSLIFAGNVAASGQDTPWYLGARVGATLYDNLDQIGTSNKIKDDINFAGGIFLGYNINDWFALETGYTYLGEMKISDARSIESNAIEVVGKFTWQTTDSLDLFAKAGAFGYKTKGYDTLSGLNDKGFDATVGFGIEQHYNNNLSVRLEYQFYNNLTLDDAPYNAEWDTHLLALGLVYSWGAPEKIAVTEAPMTQVVVEEEKIVKEPVIEEVIVKEVVIEEVATVAVVKQSINIEPKTVEVYFDFNKQNLSQKSVEQLQPIINHLQQYPDAKVVLVGHTDSHGSMQLNQKLSEQRANTVSDYLAKEYSISADRITTSGEGETSPIASNDTAEGRAKNRRVSVFSPSFLMEEK